MKIRSMFLPLIASGLMGLSAVSFAVSTSTQLVRIAGITLALTSNSPLIEAARGSNDVSAKPKLRHLKKSKCGPTSGAKAFLCDEFCTNAIPKGTDLKSCTDSDSVNTYTCTYEEVSGANCLSCPTDDETGLWFERKNIKTGNQCMVTCEYSNPDRSDEADCADICVGKNPYTDVSLTDCSLTGGNVKSLECEYEEVKEGSTCGNCPTDDDVGQGYWFQSKSIDANGSFCQTTCRYTNDGT